MPRTPDAAVHLLADGILSYLLDAVDSQILDFCKMDIGPIFFKEILCFDFLEESTPIVIWAVVKI